ncbi:MAG: 50S ribosomal protein L3 [Candidatus Taylorbacteria bacterium]|nr:50S ribosomal protein L3 [Candidatus Taylorbacteria bacterium]
MKFILGKKLQMAQVFDAAGIIHPATIIVVAPNTVTQVKTKDSDGYQAVQLGTGEKRENKLNKAGKGHLKDLGAVAHLREFRIEGEMTFKRGDKLDISTFKVGDKVNVTGISKGKGFQGVVKRHGFHGGPRTHGQKHSEREPGSIGGGLRNKVPVGMRMAGRMGSDRITVKNLKVVHIDAENNHLYVEGAIPGRRGSVVEIKAN